MVREASLRGVRALLFGVCLVLFGSGCSKPEPSPAPQERTGTVAAAVTGTASNASNFNGTSIAAGRTIWFTSVAKVSGGGSQLIHLTIGSSQIAFTAGGQSYALAVPNARVTIDPSASLATTTFDGASQSWQTTVPTQFAGNGFLTAFAYVVPTNLPGGINPVTWTASFTSDVPGLTVQWQWAAAVYTQFGPTYGSLDVKPVDDNHVSVYQNSDHAGTPEAFKTFVTGGARGGGGSNYTGSLSGTVSVTPTVTTLCSGVVCAASDQCHAVGTCDPSTGVCSNPLAADGTGCNDGNACTQSDSCQGGVCIGTNPVVCAALDACHAAGTCDVATGVCSNPPAANGTACDDGDACTQTDTCIAGTCTGASPVTCAALDACHVAGSCDPATGACTNPSAADGTACSDGNACTQSDTCQAGVCAGSNPVACAPLDACHISGACDPGTGACSNPPAANGTACSDGKACTQSDTCQTGVCTGTNPIACAALDACHVAGTCDPGTGACSNPPAANGTACNDGNACTRSDACQAGVCTGTNPVACAALDVCHVSGACNPATGVCSNPPAANGTACNDGNACTQSDTCQAGLCTGANPVACAALDACHVSGSCDPGTGACSNPLAANGTPCSDGNACTQSDSCQAGICTGGLPVACAAQDQCHLAGTCDPVTGACSNPAKLNGTACDDGNACTLFDACMAGTCSSSMQVQCPLPDACHLAGLCDPATGQCSNTPKPDGTACNDGSTCTTGDACNAGLCVGAPVVCGAADACHEAGVCNALTGQCASVPKPNGTPCDDGNLCTTGDFCNGGACTGVSQLCTPLDPCHTQGVCDLATGLCSNPVALNGTACNDLNPCTQNDTCQGGACTGSNPVTCAASDACHVAGVCDPFSGACSNPAAADGAACSDGNACTQSDSCQAGTCTGSNPVACAALDQCHAAGMCNPMTGACSSPLVADGTACSDGNGCTQSDTCHMGACVGGSTVSCAALDACHVTGMCNPATGACSNPAAADGTACSDGNGCNGAETCQAGVCTAGTSVVCAAADACHTIACDPATGACVSSAVADGGACNDGNACTTGETCVGGACGGGNAVAVDDGNPCTVDACDPVAGVTHVAAADGAACPDGDVCNGAESCQAGVCTAGTPVVCAAVDACHTVACEAATGACVTSAIADGDACNDGNACTTGEVCTGGACAGGHAVAVDDGNPCTVDACDPVAGVTHVAVADGTACPDGNVCNGIETCHAGVCAAGTPLSLDDGNPSTFDSCDPIAGVQHLAVAPLDLTVGTTIAAQGRGYYTGPTPLQTRLDGTPFPLDPKPFDDLRAAILHGRVQTMAGAPLSGVTVTVLKVPGGGDPAIGKTQTRADGAYELVVEGGRSLTVRFERAGYLGAQRALPVPMLDHAHVPDVILVEPDPIVNEIDLDGAVMQLAEGSLSQDDSGPRRATLLVPAGTTMTVPDGQGGQLALSGTVHLRATEFTVGPNGPKAMPAELPPTSGYTYAVELSVDEAGDKRVALSQPLAFYVENLIHVPVGTPVPVGSYDRAQGVWVAEYNGRTIQVLGLDAGGLAEVDSDGDGLADDALALSADERTELALRYAPGATLWRVSIPHLSTFDCNNAVGPGPGDEPPPPDKPSPGGPGPKIPPGQNGGGGGVQSSNGGSGPNGDGQGGDGPGGPPHPKPKFNCNGSSVECQNQTLHEAVPLAGLPYDLHYASDRGAGRKEPYTLFIPLSTDTVPATLSSIALTIDVAGQHIEQSFVPAPNRSTTFVWDGKDNVGRVLQGAQPVTVRVGYVYPSVYQEPAWGDRVFGEASGAPISATRGRDQFTFWRTFSSTIGELREDLVGLGGFSLGIHHFYDPAERQLWLGDGTRRSAASLSRVIGTVAGGGALTDDGVRALDLSLSDVRGVAIGPSGDLYVLDRFFVWRVGGDGLARRAAGTGACWEDWGCLDDPTDLAVGPDGTIYVAERGRWMVRRLRPDQGATFEVVAGNGQGGDPQDGLPATASALGVLGGIARGPDGTLYMTQGYNGDVGRIRAVGPDGILRTIAGGGFVNAVDGVPATQAFLSFSQDVTVAPDGSVVFDNPFGRYIRRVGVDGLLATVVGDGSTTRVDGVPAVASGLNWPVALASGPDGQLVFADGGNHVIRAVAPSGIITTLAGTGELAEQFTGEGRTAVSARFDANLQRCAAVGPDGSVYVCDSNRVLRIQPPLPGLSRGENVVLASDGATAYVFSGDGRHKRTIDARTGGTLQTFAYDDAGQLVSITDAFGNVTTLAHDNGAHTVTITAPYGPATVLVLDPATGLLASATSPAGETYSASYDADGLLTSFTNPRNLTSHMAYYANGRLQSDTDAAGAVLSFGAGVDGDGWSVKETSPTGSLTKYHTVVDAVGGSSWRDSFADGTQALVVQNADLSQTTTLPNGETVTTQLAPDPRFGLAGNFESQRTTTTPGGLVLSMSATRTAVASGLFLQSQTDTVTMNGQTSSTVFDAATSTLTRTSPMGRTSVATLDIFGRTLSSSVSGIASTAFVYDRERLASVTQAGRATAYAYDAQGQLASITDALSHTTGFGYDTAGRRTSTMRADGESTLMTYDGNGNLTSLTPPGQPAHVFTYTAVDLVDSYSAPPPSVGESASTTSYTYDLDRKLASVTRPDASLVQYGYDAIRRLGSITHPSLGVIAYGYDANGRLGAIGGPDGTLITYGYDGHLLTDIAWTGSITGAFHRDFDAFFRPAAESVNGAPVASFQYDADGLLIAAGDLTLHRDPATGRVTDTALAAGQLVDSTQYDPDFGLVAHYAATVGATEVYGYDITGRDALGRITTKTERTQGEAHAYSYAYDAVGRLMDVWKDGNDLAHLTSHYAYDANGNRLAKTTPAGTVSGTYDAQDRITSYGTLSYAFTPNGELATKTDTATGDVTQYTYDARGDLKRVVLHAGAPMQRTIDYVVDGLSHRMWKKVDGVSVKGWLYRDALAPIAELDGAGNVTARFVYGTKLNVPEYVITASGRFRVVSDHLGSPHVVVDEATGAVVMRAEYDEFGNVTVAPEGAAGMVPFGFAGGIWDPETGLVRFGARDYEPVTGRWTARDPLRFSGGLNLYGYVLNDPVDMLDAAGQDPYGTTSCAYYAQMCDQSASPYYCYVASNVCSVAGDNWWSNCVRECLQDCDKGTLSGDQNTCEPFSNATGAVDVVVCHAGCFPACTLGGGNPFRNHPF